MLTKQELHLELSHNDAVKVLKQRLRRYPPIGTVDDNSFCLYRSLPTQNPRGRFLFVFEGMIESHSAGTTVKYRVRPDATTCFFAALLLSVLLYSGIKAIFSDVSIYFLLGIVSFNVIYNLGILDQMSRCIEQFNRILQSAPPDTSRSGDGSVS